MKFLDDELRKQIGFKYVVDRLELHTPFGREKQRAIVTFTREQETLLLKKLHNVDTVVKKIKTNTDSFKEISNLMDKLKDIRNSLRRCSELNTLDDVELFHIKNFCINFMRLSDIFNKLDMSLFEICFELPDNIIKLLDPEGNLSPSFHVYDAYSPELKAVRMQKRKVEDKICNCSDDFEIKKLKDERLNYVIREENEELKVRKKLTLEISKYVKTFNNDIDSLAELDFTIAKARLAIDYNGVMPYVTEDMNISFKGAFSPEAADILKENSRSFVPIDIELRSGTSIITGANMGGKSVALKTVVLNLLLGSMGFFVFAEKAAIPLCDFMFYLSDDFQSVEHGLSTFGAEIIKLNEILEYVKSETGFVALDEFARGTNPKEGCYMVRALCQYLNEFKSISLISTHYDEVADDAMVHYQVRGLKDINHNIKTMQALREIMDYRLERVPFNKEVPKDALNISILLGLDEELIKRIKGYYED